MENNKKKSTIEKIEDSVDEVLYNAQNKIYGERKSINEDIPATMETPEGLRRINKFATRRNIGRMILKHPKIILVWLGVIVVVAILVSIL